MTLLFFWLEILVLEKFLFSLKVNPFSIRKVRIPFTPHPGQTFVSFRRQKHHSSRRGRKIRTCSGETVFAFDFSCFQYFKLLFSC
jgi:hypothetical protein